MRICNGCKKNKNVNAFYNHKGAVCMVCVKKRAKQYREEVKAGTVRPTKEIDTEPCAGCIAELNNG